MRLRPFFSFYGAKWRLAPKYPSPVYETLVEPFAGSACYSLLHHTKNVILNDIDPILFTVWDYLIKVSEREILDLPDIENSVEDHNLTQEQKWLIGFNLNAGVSHPCKQLSKWALSHPSNQFWCEGKRRLIATQLQHIRHWKVTNKSYQDLDNPEATWFIDPPYNNEAGKRYKNHTLDYSQLSEFCIIRNGQVIVCENKGADWLPFEDFAETTGQAKKKITKEVLYEQRSLEKQQRTWRYVANTS